MSREKIICKKCGEEIFGKALLLPDGYKHAEECKEKPKYYAPGLDPNKIEKENGGRKMKKDKTKTETETETKTKTMEVEEPKVRTKAESQKLLKKKLDDLFADGKKALCEVENIPVVEPKKRGRKPNIKIVPESIVVVEPKKRGRKPNVKTVDPIPMAKTERQTSYAVEPKAKAKKKRKIVTPAMDQVDFYFIADIIHELSEVIKINSTKRNEIAKIFGARLAETNRKFSFNKFYDRATEETE